MSPCHVDIGSLALQTDTLFTPVPVKRNRSFYLYACQLTCIYFLCKFFACQKRKTCKNFVKHIHWQAPPSPPPTLAATTLPTSRHLRSLMPLDGPRWINGPDAPCSRKHKAHQSACSPQKRIHILVDERHPPAFGMEVGMEP